jgi:hypothetical protein
MSFMRRKVKSPAISELSTAVYDTGRRGEPKMGCDCVQCFGYCLVDRDEAFRQQVLKGPAPRARDGGTLDFK